jgi:hypothetical protein
VAYVTDRIMIYFYADRCTCLNLMALKKAVSLFSSLLLLCCQKFTVFYCARPALPTSVFCHVRVMSREAQSKFPLKLWKCGDRQPNALSSKKEESRS